MWLFNHSQLHSFFKSECFKKFLNKLEKANAYLKLSFKGKLPFFCYKLDVIHIKMININITQDSLWTYQQNQLIILISVHVLFQCVVVSC